MNFKSVPHYFKSRPSRTAKFHSNFTNPLPSLFREQPYRYMGLCIAKDSQHNFPFLKLCRIYLFETVSCTFSACTTACSFLRKQRVSTLSLFLPGAPNRCSFLASKREYLWETSSHPPCITLYTPRRRRESLYSPTKHSHPLFPN